MEARGGQDREGVQRDMVEERRWWRGWATRYGIVCAPGLCVIDKA